MKTLLAKIVRLWKALLELDQRTALRPVKVLVRK
jgi:hypothetical protein